MCIVFFGRLLPFPHCKVTYYFLHCKYLTRFLYLFLGIGAVLWLACGGGREGDASLRVGAACRSGWRWRACHCCAALSSRCQVKEKRTERDFFCRFSPFFSFASGALQCSAGLLVLSAFFNVCSCGAWQTCCQCYFTFMICRPFWSSGLISSSLAAFSLASAFLSFWM